MKDRKFEIADQDQVFELDAIAEKFFAEILSMDYFDIMNAGAGLGEMISFGHCIPGSVSNIGLTGLVHSQTTLNRDEPLPDAFLSQAPPQGRYTLA